MARLVIHQAQGEHYAKKWAEIEKKILFENSGARLNVPETTKAQKGSRGSGSRKSGAR